MEAIVLT